MGSGSSALTGRWWSLSVLVLYPSRFSYCHEQGDGHRFLCINLRLATSPPFPKENQKMPEVLRMSSSAQRREHHCTSRQRSVQRRSSEELCGGEESRTSDWGPWFRTVCPRTQALPLRRSPCTAQRRRVPCFSATAALTHRCATCNLQPY